mmetsp:Transcript_43877/g.73124  ORF Transcript_43877/g.73124 Transcript_43877/m.73124 type:complete len:275 (+) Transcript_43877:62-886(+)
MEKFRATFGPHPPIIAMIHVDALPGTPKNRKSVKEIVELAVEEASVYRNAGVDAVMIENMHDIPYLKSEIGPEIVSSMSVIGLEVKKVLGQIPCGIQILAGANNAALAVAQSAGLQFIRAEGFVFAHVADEGIFESCAGNLLRYRRQIGAENVLVFADIKKKHSSHAITADVDIGETAKAAEYFLADGVIVTGVSTGSATDIEDVTRTKGAVSLPVLVGSGVSSKNVQQYVAGCDGVIVGSDFKHDGSWNNGVDPVRTFSFMDNIRRIRKEHHL